MNYTILDGSDKMKTEDIARLLKMTYWADKRPVETIEKSMQNAACFGARVEGRDELAAFARVITDYATTYYLADVVVDPSLRGQGLGKALVGHILSRPEYNSGGGKTGDKHPPFTLRSTPLHSPLQRFTIGYKSRRMCFGWEAAAWRNSSGYTAWASGAYTVTP